MLSSLRIALAFLTRIPVGDTLAEPEALAGAVRFFPIVGALLGAVLAGVDASARWLLPESLASAAVVVTWVVLSGALHLDGLCDVFDGLMGGADRESALRILRDPRAGTAGVAAVTLVLWTKLAALSALDDGYCLQALLLAPALGRTWLLPALALPPARPEGLARVFRGPAIMRQAALALLALTVCAGLLCGGAGIAAVAASAVPVAWLLHTAWRRFGGTTGDVCGAAAELSETVFLVALCAFYGRAAPH